MGARWIGAWLGGALIGIANGIARQATYGKRVSDRTAHQLSGLSAMGAFTAHFWSLERRWLPSTRVALKVGGAWALLTVAFEFGFGRGVAKQSWEELIADYILAEGRTRPLVLTWIALGPAIVRALDGPSGDAPRGRTQTTS